MKFQHTVRKFLLFFYYLNSLLRLLIIFIPTIDFTFGFESDLSGKQD